MEPFYFRVRRETMGSPPGAIIASLPGRYVKQLHPEPRDLPPNFGRILGAHIAGDLVWLEPIMVRVALAPPLPRRVYRLRTRREATVERAIRLLP